VTWRRNPEAFVVLRSRRCDRRTPACYRKQPALHRSQAVWM